MIVVSEDDCIVVAASGERFSLRLRVEAIPLGRMLEGLPAVQELNPQNEIFVAGGKATILKLNALLDHDQLTNCNPKRHVDHARVQIEPGSGLGGGGDLTKTRVLRLALASLESYVPERGASIPFVDLDKTHGKISFEKLFELFRDWMKEEVKEEANAI